jgi:hypothetical protein
MRASSVAETGVSICNRNRIMTGLRFLFRVTLRRLDHAAEIYHLREPQKIPLVMSQDETRRLLAAAGSLKARLLRNCNTMKGNSDEAPPKQVRLTELEASRCWRRSLLRFSVRNSASSHSESQATVMLVFPTAKLEASSCGRDRLFCLRCCANFSKP